MYRVLSSSIDTRIIHRNDMYDNAEQVEDKEDLDASQEFFDVLNVAVDLYNANEVTKKKKKKLKAVKEKLDRLYKRVTTSIEDTKFDDVLFLAVAFFHMGLHYTEYIDTERLADGEDYFVKCLKLLEGRYCERKTVLTVMKALAELKIIWYHKHGLEACYELLMKSMEIYLEYTQDKNDYPQPTDVSIMLGIDQRYSDDPSMLDHLYLSALEALVQLFESNPENMHKLVEYTHKVLNKQLLNDIPLDCGTAMKNIERYNNWVLTLVDLCRYFIYHKRLVEARDHLTVAQQIVNLCSHENDITQAKESPDSSQEWMNIMCKFMKAHVATSRGSYAVELLHAAKENLVLKIKGCDTSEPSKTDDSRALLVFTGLKKLSELSERGPVRIPEFILNSDDARSVLLEGIKCYNIARAFFTMERSFEIYSQLTIDMSKAYKYKAALEESIEKKCLLQKSLVDTLLPIAPHLCKTVDPKLRSQQKAVLREITIAYSATMDECIEDLGYRDTKQLRELENVVGCFVNILRPYKQQIQLL